jgi:alpha-L-rhamnosidase
MEWAFRDLAGIDTDGPGYRHILIKPGPPSPGSNSDVKPIDWVKAEYTSCHGKIVCDWKREGDRFDIKVTIPANTTATLVLPVGPADGVRESGKPLAEVIGFKLLRLEKNRPVVSLESGRYHFECLMAN